MIDLTVESTRAEFRKVLALSERVVDQRSERREELIRKTVGDNWAETSPKKETITSLLFRAYETFSFDLIINRPRCHITARNQKHAGFAANFTLAVNNYAKQINFADELMAGVMDAMFGMAVFKRYWSPTGVNMRVINPDIEEPGEQAEIEDWMRYREQQYVEVDPGHPMIERLCPEDWIPDTAMGRRRHFRFEAHRYRRPIDEVKADKRFDLAVRQAVRSTSKFNEEHKNKADRISRGGYEHEEEDLEKTVVLWDVWLPKTKQFVTLSNDASLPPLMAGPWKGPPGGPFTPLIFSTVPDNFEPVSILGNLEASHDILNSLLRKMTRQAARQKEILTYSGPEQDAQRIRDTMDGGLTRVMAPEAQVLQKFGGVNPSIGQFANVVNDIGNKEGGNLDLIAGVAQQSDTASQDEMLNARSSAMQSKRMQRVAGVAGELYEALGWMLWHDVATVVPGQRDLPEYGVKVDATWQPDERYGEIEDYEFSYTPFNEQYMSPQQKAQVVNGLITNFYVPLLPVLQQSGQTLDLTEIATFQAEMLNTPELLRFVKPLPAPPPGMMMGGGAPGGGAPEDGGLLTEAPSMPGDNVYRHINSTPSPVSGREENQWADMATME